MGPRSESVRRMPLLGTSSPLRFPGSGGAPGRPPAGASVPGVGWGLGGFCSAVLTVILLKAAPALAAGLALALAIDVSASVTAESYVLQQEGVARAFDNPRLGDAIAAVPGGVEVLLLEWSDPDQVNIAVEWRRVDDAAGAAAFAAAVRNAKRSSHGRTAIGPALLAAASAFDRLPEPASRRVIDISGDGMANFGLPPSVARDRIVASGISINGLAILTEEPWLEGYYRTNVIGGPQAFVAAARDFSSFGDAILRKLVQEVADAQTGPPASAADAGGTPALRVGFRCSKCGSARSR